MSFRLEMLQVCRVAPKLLGDSTPLVCEFVRQQQNADGAFKDRQGRSDLYYTVFGLDSLIALQSDLPVAAAREYLRQFGDGTSLDFVHLCALVRCWAAVTQADPVASSSFADGLHRTLKRVAEFRTTDGGFNVLPAAEHGTVYGCFLATGAIQDLNTIAAAHGKPPVGGPATDRILDCLAPLQTPDGAWANERHMRAGSTNATAAAISLLRALHQPMPSTVGDWLVSQLHPMGGFVAAPGAPIPDLLSTATALHALSGLQRDLTALKDPCLDFIDSLWTNSGSFHGHWTDDCLDCEYTFYGLLALGHLAL